MDLFRDVVTSILITKKDLTKEEGFDKCYSSFVVNRALSFHYDCVLQANEINKFPNAPRALQYSFLLNSVRGYKRPFRKWEKRETIDDLEAVKEYYNYSYQKAKEALVLLNATQLEQIRKAISKGGTDDSKPRRVRGSGTS